MAITVGCDRCKQIVDGVAHVRGHVIKREYCEDCVVQIDDMLTDIDMLHTKVARQFVNGLGTIRRKYAVEGGLLPDVSI